MERLNMAENRSCAKRNSQPIKNVVGGISHRSRHQQAGRKNCQPETKIQIQETNSKPDESHYAQRSSPKTTSYLISTAHPTH